MADTRIAWATKVLNVVSGCTKVSAGCRNCYAERMAKRLAGRVGYPEGDGFAVTLHSERLEEPLRWRKPERVFMPSMGDLFHLDVPDGFIEQVIETAVATPRHTYLILTKRPERMLAWVTSPMGRFWAMPKWENVWLGVSAENQVEWDHRVSVLSRVPAAVRWVSVEPMLGPIDVGGYVFDREREIRHLTHGPAVLNREQAESITARPVDWVVVGGESGPGHRPMELDWARSVRDQCRAAGVAFWFKQESGRFPGHNATLDGQEWRQLPEASRGR